MKKMIFTLMLTIVSSAWMTSEAGWCMPSVRTLTEPWIEVNGTFQAEGFPCEPGEPCANCLTIVLVTSNKTYYLVTDDGQLIEYLDTIQLGTKATVSGIPFEHGSYDYIQVSHIETDRTSQLPSLCDEWNVWYESFGSFGPISFDKVVKYQLTTDMLINGQQYVKLTSDKDSPYLGAMREGNNRDIYYIPADSTHEYLLYAFNAQVGDTLSNLWVGGFGRDYQGVVQAISNGSPRIFTIGVKYEYEPGSIQWIEGVGSPETPMGMAVVPDVPADIGVYTLLCAYKNGEHIFTSDLGEQYGCEYNNDPYSTPADTIPLYAQDDPGSSTVDPVDPNQVVVTLKNDELTIKEFSGETISYQLTNLQSNNVPASRRAPQTQTPASRRAPQTQTPEQTQTFQNEVSLTLTEEGRYTLILTNPNWDYSIYGTFNYPRAKDGIDNTPGSSSDTCGKAHKILIDGQLLIEKNNKTYNVLGTPVK